MLSREPEEGARPGVQAEEALVKGAQRFWDPCSKAYIDPSGILGGLAHRNYMLLRATGRRKSSKVNQTLKPESMGISVESVEWVLVINTYWASVGAGFWLATKEVSSWGAQTLTSSQDLYLPYFWSDHSLLPTWSFWVGGTAKAAGWSTPARPIERHGALSRHIPCAVTSCISCSDLHLPTVLAAATMEVFFFPGRVGEWGGWWRDVKTVFLTVWQLRPCTLRKLLLQPHWVVACISSKFLIISLSKVGHKLHSKRWAESYSSPTDFFWKVLHISQNYRFSSLAFFFLTNKKA